MNKLTPSAVNELERISREEAPVKLHHATLVELCTAWRRQHGVDRRPDVVDLQEVKS